MQPVCNLSGGFAVAHKETRVMWNVVIKKYWPGALRDIMSGFAYVPKSVYKCKYGELIKWVNTDKTGITKNPKIWWEVRDKDGVLKGHYVPQEKGERPPFEWATQLVI